MVYGNSLENRNETVMEWNFWLWMKGPEATPESGFRLDKEKVINIWVGEYYDELTWFWAYGNFTAISLSKSLQVACALSISLTSFIL